MSGLINSLGFVRLDRVLELKAPSDLEQPTAKSVESYAADLDIYMRIRDTVRDGDMDGQNPMLGSRCEGEFFAGLS